MAIKWTNKSAINREIEMAERHTDIRLNFDGSLDWEIENSNYCVKWVPLLVLSNLNILENRTFEIMVWNRSCPEWNRAF